MTDIKTLSELLISNGFKLQDKVYKKEILFFCKVEIGLTELKGKIFATFTATFIKELCEFSTNVSYFQTEFIVIEKTFTEQIETLIKKIIKIAKVLGVK